MKFEDFINSHFYWIVGIFFGLMMGGLAIDAFIH